MLCQFSFENFMSYRSETVFDFQAVNIPEFSDSLICRDGCSNLLPVAVIYGPNGGGKSNLLRALGCLICTVVKPIHDLEKNRLDFIVQQKISCEPFLFHPDAPNAPTSFQIYFRTGGYEYRYFLSVLREEIVAETLDRRKIGGKRPAHIFSREGKDIEVGAILRSENVNTNVNSKMPFLSFLAINYEIAVIREVQSWFESCIVRSYASPAAEMSVLFSDNAKFKQRILEFLNDCGIDVTDYRLDMQEKQIFLTREIDHHSYELPYSHESDGTKKLIALLPIILLALQEGRLVVIDELDAKLHPKLLRYVISLFKNTNVNRNGAQLLFTSHDMATMKNTVFRRDEIWFAALDADHSSEIYSLYDIRREDNERVNSTAAFDKQYMEGRYGADPYLQNILSGGDWS
ncbi:MAG: ATP-binding protein [Lachnospiraceae bacterium]|nr:ATP-binding protein [Lachnospiraceae bacterium]